MDFTSVAHEANVMFIYAGSAYLIQTALQLLPLEFHTFISLHVGSLSLILVLALLEDLKFYRTAEPLTFKIQFIRLLTNLILTSVMWFACLKMYTWLDIPYFDSPDSKVTIKQTTDRIVKTFGTIFGSALLIFNSYLTTVTIFAILRSVIAFLHLIFLLLRTLITKARTD